MPRLFLPLFLVPLSFFAVAGANAQVIESIFLENGTSWHEAQNWFPAEVPNNVGSKTFNVTLRYFDWVQLDSDVTISNLTLEGNTVLFVRGATLQIPGTSSNGAYIGVIDEDDYGIKLEEGGNLLTGSLASFSNGTLTGAWRLFGGTANRMTTLQFPGADIRKLSGALVGLEGSFTRIIDENGLDALRNFSEVGPGSRFNLNDRHFVTPGNFTNNGTLNIGTLHVGDVFGGPTSFTVTGALTNFDAATNTLESGIYRLGSGPNAETLLRFPGANIVNNAAKIYLDGPLSRIVDQNGADALAHFRHNLAGGDFTRNEPFTTEGDFTNDGTLRVSGLFKVTGALTNFSTASKTLTGGTFSVSQMSLQFAGADIVHNSASLVLGRAPAIVDENGNDGLRNLADNQPTGTLRIQPAAELATAGDFTNAGTVTIDRDEAPRRGVLSIPPGFHYLQTAGETHVGGSLVADTISIEGGLVSGEAGALWGDVVIGNATFASTYYTTEVKGNLTFSPESHFRATVFSTGYSQLYVGGTSTVLNGVLEIEVPDGYRPPRGSVHYIVSSAPIISGNFTNAPSGARVSTTDGKGSFLVTYFQHDIRLTDYQAVPPPAQLLNISTRAQVLTGDSLVVAGFIVTGAVPKKIAVRGIGPSLTPYGVTGALQDPTIQVLDQNGAVVATNNDWRESQSAEIKEAGLAPGDDREAALITTVNPGNYTVALRGAGNTVGTGVVEVYDMTATSSSKLANISTRAYVGTDTNVLIGGFIAGGDSGNIEIIIRAIGPNLKNYGVPNFLADPTLELRDANGALKAENDDFYQASPEIPWELRPWDARESAIRTTVAPGYYTAIVRGKNGAQGVGLVEVYDLNGP